MSNKIMTFDDSSQCVDVDGKEEQSGQPDEEEGVIALKLKVVGR